MVPSTLLRRLCVAALCVAVKASHASPKEGSMVVAVKEAFTQVVKACTDSVSLDLLEYPVVLSCGHSVSSGTLTMLSQYGPNIVCPLCRYEMPGGDSTAAVPNHQLRALVELLETMNITLREVAIKADQRIADQQALTQGVVEGPDHWKTHLSSQFDTADGLGRQKLLYVYSNINICEHDYALSEDLMQTSLYQFVLSDLCHCDSSNMWVAAISFVSGLVGKNPDIQGRIISDGTLSILRDGLARFEDGNQGEAGRLYKSIFNNLEHRCKQAIASTIKHKDQST